MHVYMVQLLGGRDGSERSSIIYTGSSLQYAHHDINTASTAAVLAGGVLLIILRKNGEIIARVNVADGQAIATPAGFEAPKGGQ